jgi:hypothetical protein
MVDPSWVPSWLLSWLPRYLLPPWQKMLDWLFPNRSRARLIFIEQPMSSWAYLDGEGAIQLHLLMQVTNESKTDALVVSRVQVRLQRAVLKSLFRKDPWQDCMLVDVGEERLTPGFIVRPLLARTTTVFRIIHHYKSERPEPNQPIKCRLRVTDQHGRVHPKRLIVPSR